MLVSNLLSSLVHCTLSLPIWQESLMIESYNFTGDAVTYLGFVGVISTAIIVISVFKSFYNSPLNK
jgi:hypothetical protein